jgi:hypothetical protein
MDIPDLRLEAPRRWNAEIGGVRWLARLADKARAANVGALGTYLYGQSPIDRSLLGALQLDHDEFERLAVSSGGDDELVAALQAHDPGLQRARVWSDALPKRYGWELPFLDIDDGYSSSPFHRVISLGVDFIAGLAKRLIPSAYGRSGTLRP